MNNLQILVVQKHDDRCDGVVEGLTLHGHLVRCVAVRTALDSALAAVTTDLVLLNGTWPEAHQRDTVRQIRQHYPEIGIILITAATLQEERQHFYQQGGDLYLTQPLSLEELVAAIDSLSRRLTTQGKNRAELTLNPLSLQLHGLSVTAQLSKQECVLLTAFIQAEDQLLKNEQLLALSGLEMSTINKKALEVRIVRLRKKLELAGAVLRPIRSIRGYGYQLCVAIHIAPIKQPPSSHRVDQLKRNMITEFKTY